MPLTFPLEILDPDIHIHRVIILQQKNYKMKIVKHNLKWLKKIHKIKKLNT